MPVTLAQAQLDTQDDIQPGVIEEFREDSLLLDLMTFDDAVSPGTNGATLTYGYTRELVAGTAAFRAINTEFVAQEATKIPVTVECKVFGGKYEIDRVLARAGDALINEIAFQQSEKIKAARSLFHDTVINGDVALDPNQFDGLDKALAGSSTEYGTGTFIDLSTSAAIDANYKSVLDNLDLFLSLLVRTPNILGMNNWLKNRIAACARRANYLTQSEDAFGKPVDAYRGIPLVDLGEKCGTVLPVVPIEARDEDNNPATPDVTGLTDLYAFCLGMDGLHGVTIANGDFINTHLPDFSTEGAVKGGDVEMIATIALKKSRAAGVYRNWKVI